MSEPAPRVHLGACPRCYGTVTAKMARVLTTEGTYHHRCYMGVRQPRRPKARAQGPVAHLNGHAARPGDRLPRLLEHLAQGVVLVILVGTALILLAHALP